MTNKKHPDQFDWATELSDAQGHVTLSAQEANEIGARLRSMGEKLKAYEDLGGAADDVQLLRMGYAAARLEIQSLQARIKTMAEERSDELMVAHLDGRMRAAQPAGAQQPAQTPQADSQPAVDALAEAEYFIDNPSAWSNFDQRASDAIAAVCKAFRAARAPADSVLEDAARLDWLLLRISGAEFRRIGVHYSGNARRADVDAARKQGANHD